MTRRQTRISEEELRRTRRTEALERLDGLETLTPSQQVLRARLRALEAADPVVKREAELRRMLGLK